MIKTKPKRKKIEIPLNAWLNGMSSRQDRNMPIGSMSNIENWLYPPDGGIETALGWETLSKGLDSGSYPDAASGGWNSATYGVFRDYVQNQSGKLMAFEGGAICDTATGVTFETATSNDIALPNNGDAEFRGAFYYREKFFLYTDLRVYEVTMADGTITSRVDFLTDTGSQYSPIRKIIPRFGQLWCITAKDRVFWSDVGGYQAVNGDAVTNEGFRKKFDEWQYVKHGGSIGSVTVEYNTEYQWIMRSVRHGGNDTTLGTNYCFIGSDPSGILSSGDKVLARQTGGGKKDNEVFSSSAAATKDLTANASAGDTIVRVGSGPSAYALRPGDSITISDDTPDTEVGIIKSITYLSGAVEFEMEDALTYNYTTAADAKITADDIYKVTIQSNWDATIASGSLRADLWANAVLDTDYNLTANPFDDEDIDGHIRLIKTQLMRAAEEVRVDYTPVENDYVSGTAGYMDIAEHQGDILAATEGPDRQEAQGSEIIYIFKNTGDIHAIVGHPGVDGTAGTVDPVFICSGLRAREKSIQVLRYGVVFGVLAANRYKVYLLPYGAKWERGENIPQIVGDYRFDDDIPFDDSTYTIKEYSGILGGDTYLIGFPNSTSGLPSTNEFIYACDIVRDQRGHRGRWTRLKESTKDEYAEDQSVTIGSGPSSCGLYTHDNNLYRVYYVKTGHDYSGNTRYYETARYGWLVGDEECKSRYVMTKDNGNATYTTVIATEFFKVKLKTGMVKIAKRLNIRKFLYNLHLQGGVSGDGIDLTYSVWKDLSATVIDAVVYPRTISNLTDATGALNFIRETKDNFTCEYFQIEIIFDNIKYNDTDSRPGRLLFRDLGIEAYLRSGDVLLSEEDNA